jgi:hypothetical protein
MSIDARKKSKRGRPPVDSEEVRSRMERSLLDAIDAWIAAQPEPRPSRPGAIRRLVAESLGKQETAAREVVGVELSAPTTSKSEELLHAAILAFADEIANDPDNPWYPDGYEAKVRQVASSPHISQQLLVDCVDNEFRTMNNKLKAAAEHRRRKK